MRSSSPTADRPLSARTSATVAAILGGGLELKHRAARRGARRVADYVARAEGAQHNALQGSVTRVGTEHAGEEARRFVRRQLGSPDSLAATADGYHALARSAQVADPVHVA